MLTLLLLACQTPTASAGREAMSIANDEVKDGVHGAILTMDGEEAGALKRQGLGLDPAKHRVFPVITDQAGEVLYSGHQSPVDGGATATPPLPADDSRHSFFVPYHRIQTEPGQHEVEVALWLDAGQKHEPILVSSARGKLRTPSSEWVFASVEQPPTRERILRWRARLGQDVVAERRDTPAVVVLSEGDAIELDVWDAKKNAWTDLNKRSLRAAADRSGMAGAKVRSLLVRKSPPGIVDGAVSARVVTDGDPALLVDLRWALQGRSVDALLPIEAHPFAASADGTRWELPSNAVLEGPDRARHLIPFWALPNWLEAQDPFRLGWVVMARSGSGSPLTRDLILGRSEHDVTIEQAMGPRALSATIVESKVVDDEGLYLQAQVAWHIPPSMAALGTPRLTARWSGPNSVGETVTGPWTLCAETGAPNTCAEGLGLGPLSAEHGLSTLRLPLAWSGATDPAIRVDVGIPGYHPLTTRLAADLGSSTLRKVVLTPKKASFNCEAGSTVRLVWSAAGREVGGTTPRPCAKKVKWGKTDAVSLDAWSGDELQLGVVVNAETVRATSYIVGEAATWSALVEPSAGVDSLKLNVRTEPLD